MIGSFNLPAGVAEVQLVGQRFGIVPNRVVVSVIKPNGAPTVGACVIHESINDDGFRVALTGITPASGYRIVYFVALEIQPLVEGFDAWLEGVPVLVPAADGGFSAWLEGTPMIEQSSQLN